MGHFMNMVGKDVINRYKLMQGYRVHMMPGFDCYGLGIEDQALVYNKKLPTSLKPQTPLSDDAATLAKRAICRQHVKDSIIGQMRDLTQWGILTDFRYSYMTMMPQYEANVLDRFADLADKKMIKTGSRPVFWSVS